MANALTPWRGAAMKTATPRLVAAVMLAALVTFPAGARGQQRQGPPPGVFTEPRLLGRAIDVALRTGGEGSDADKSGFYPELSNMITGAGWISGGPGYRQWLRGDQVFVDGSAAVSWRLYRMAQGRAELTNLARSRVALGAQARWQDATQVTYFGQGAGTTVADRSEYRLISTDVAGYATFRPARQVAVTATFGWLAAPEVAAPAGAFRRGYPDARETFPTDPVFSRPEQPSYQHAGLAWTADTRDHRGHPTRGGAYRAAWSHYAEQDGGPFSFDRFEAEAAAFLPTAGSRLVIALRGWVVGTATADGQTVPFYLLPALGGGNTLRGYADYRFHDRHLTVVNAEARVALFTHVDAAVFADAGSVATRLGDLGLNRRSYGAGVRLHTGTATLARLDIAHGAEGGRVLFRTADPFRLRRHAQRTAAIPFVP
jgi:hypothetical protein